MKRATNALALLLMYVKCWVWVRGAVLSTWCTTITLLTVDIVHVDLDGPLKAAFTTLSQAAKYLSQALKFGQCCYSILE